MSSREDWSISTTQRLPDPNVPGVTVVVREVAVLGVGIDWSEEFHLVALGRVEEGVIEVRRVEHTPAAVAALVARIASLEADPAEVRVVIETRHGLLVEALLDAGYTVLPVNPDLIARRRGPAKKKDDTEDARIGCLLALDRHADLQALVPHGELAGELRAIARDDARAARDERRLLNRLRVDLQATFPAALGIAGDGLGAPTVLRLLHRWPSADALRTAGRDELVAFARSAQHGWPERFADRVIQALAEEQFVARDHLIRAKPTVRQEPVRRRPPARVQPLPGRRPGPVGVLQPVPLRLGPRVLRQPDREGQDPPRGAARPGEPLARGALALPAQGRALRRGHPPRQPSQGPATPRGRLTPRPPEAAAASGRAEHRPARGPRLPRPGRDPGVKGRRSRSRSGPAGTRSALDARGAGP